MLDDVLVFLKDRLNQEFTSSAGLTDATTNEEMVVFLDGEKTDPITFKLGAVTTLLINVEEEHKLRPADPYVEVSASGEKLIVNPPISLNLFVMFVARYKRYEQGLGFLSDVIQYFQNHRVFDHTNAPELTDEIEKLVLELITLPFSEQNELWNALRTTYLPSVLYKVKMVVYRDMDARRATEVSDKAVRTSQ